MGAPTGPMNAGLWSPGARGPGYSLTEGVGPPRLLDCPLRACHGLRPRRPRRLLALSGSRRSVSVGSGGFPGAFALGPQSGSPRFLGHLPMFGDVGAAFSHVKGLGESETIISGLSIHGPHARLLTHRLRRFRTVGAEPATDLPGSALIGRVSHPLDSEPNFKDASRTSYSNGPALPGRTDD